jgi:hypothetical protein
MEKGLMCMEPDRMAEKTPSCKGGGIEKGGKERESGSSGRDIEDDKMR